MKISIIIPLYNKEEYISRAVDSVLSQSYQDFELIVIDDGSTDEGPAIVNAYNNPRITLVSQPNAGPGAARNHGIELAQGEYLAFLDADDEWLPSFLEESLALLEQYGHEIALVSSCYLKMPEGTSTAAQWEARGLHDGVLDVVPHMDAALFVTHLAYICPWSTLVRRDVVRRYGGFYAQERCLYGEDAHLWMKILLNHPIAVSLTPRVRFHTEASELSHNLSGPYPVEPFLRHPEDIEQSCPSELHDLLKRVLALRAIQTASELGVWHRWREGQSLLRRFYHPSILTLPRFYLANIIASPFWPVLRKTWRIIKGKPVIIP